MLTRARTDTYNSNMSMAAPGYAPISPTPPHSRPTSFDYMHKTPYRGSAISESASQGYHSRVPSQLSEMNPNLFRVSVLNPNLETVSELGGSEIADPARHELSAAQEIRVFRGSDQAMGPPQTGTETQDQPGSRSSAISPPREQNELHLWDGTAGHGAAPRHSGEG